MKKSSKAFIILLVSLCTAFSLAGCGSEGGKSGAVAPADSQAASDPNGKGLALLTEFFALPEGDRADWARNKGFDWSVFDNVSDPQLKAQYEQYVKPLLAGS